MSGVETTMSKKSKRLRAPPWKAMLAVIAALLGVTVLARLIGSAEPDRPFAKTSIKGLFSRIEKKRSVLLDALAVAYDHCPTISWRDQRYPLPPKSWESVQVEAMRELALRTNEARQVVEFVAGFLRTNVNERTGLSDAGFQTLLALRGQERDLVRRTLLTWFNQPRNVPLEHIIDWTMAADPNHPDVVHAITNELVRCFSTLPHTHPRLSTAPWPGGHIRRELMFCFTRLRLEPAARANILALLADTPAASIARELATFLVDLPLSDEERLQLLTRLATSPHDAAAAAALGALASGRTALQPDGWLKPLLERELRNPARSSIVGSSIATALLEREDGVEHFTPFIQTWLTNRTELGRDTLVPVASRMILMGVNLAATEETLEVWARKPEFVSRVEACFAYWLISTNAGSTISMLLDILSQSGEAERELAADRLESVIEGRADRLTMLLDGRNQLETRRKAVADYFHSQERRDDFRQTLELLIDAETKQGKKLGLRNVLRKFVEYHEPGIR